MFRPGFAYQKCGVVLTALAPATTAKGHLFDDRDRDKERRLMPALLYVFALCTAIDGDTLQCGGERVRLARIDTPERYEAGFREAKSAMRLLIEGREVRCVVAKRERYGRLLGECGTDDTPSLSDEMLARGLAERYRGQP